MCIIVAKPAGVQLPPKATLENCFRNNNDGAGIMYVCPKRLDAAVTIEKGLMTEDAFFSTLEKLKHLFDTTKAPMVFHFRIGTQGANNQANCHPFPISDDENQLQKLRLNVPLGVAHNGIISLTSEYSYCSIYSRSIKREAVLSDTQIFIRDYLALLARDRYFYRNKNILKLIERMIKGSKMTFLTDRGEVINIGDFTKDRGCYYSNTSYKDDYYTKILTYNYGGGNNYNNNYRYSKKLMWLEDECYTLESGEYYPLESYTYLIDSVGLIYKYDYERDKAVYWSALSVYNNNLQKVTFCGEKATLLDVEWSSPSSKSSSK